jgi:hypothetical protein
MATSQPKQRYFPNLKDEVPYNTETELKQLRQYAYDLFDSRTRVLDYTLSASKRVDAELISGKPLVVIARQDTVGGWNVEWATNADSSLKFKGTALVTLTTTANTYTAYYFIATSEREAMLVSFVTGGNLS